MYAYTIQLYGLTIRFFRMSINLGFLLYYRILVLPTCLAPIRRSISGVSRKAVTSANSFLGKSFLVLCFGIILYLLDYGLKIMK